MNKRFGIFISAVIVLWVFAVILGVSARVITSKENAGVAAAESGKTHYVLHMDYPNYRSSEEITEKADLVYEGVIKSYSFEMIDILLDDGKNDTGYQAPHQEFPYTVYEVLITQVYKGDIKEGDIIRLRILGGEFENVIYTMPEGQEMLEQEHQYLFLCTRYGDLPVCLLNPHQSVFDLTEPNYNSGEISADSIRDQFGF